MAMKRRRIKSTEESEVVAQAVELQLDRWLDLPSGILELIMKRLSYIDLINFRAVCKSWNSIKNQTPLVVHEYPWLVLFDETAISTLPSLVNNTSCSCQLFDPTYKKLYKIDMSHIHNFRIKNVYESKYGWLLISPSNHSSNYFGKTNPNYVLFAFTPFSSVNNFIQLPTFDESRRAQAIYFATFTSNPSMDQDCLFIVLGPPSHEYSMFGISTCRRGDKSWSTRNLKYSSPDSLKVNFMREVRHWIYSEGNIYYMVVLKRYNGTPRSRREYIEGYRPAVVNHHQQRVTRVGNVNLVEPNRIVKWSDVVNSHGTDGDSLCGSLMKLDDENHDDSKYWVSKLRKELSDLIYHYPYTSDCDYDGIWNDKKGGCKILKIDPPHRQ